MGLNRRMPGWPAVPEAGACSPEEMLHAWDITQGPLRVNPGPVLSNVGIIIQQVSLPHEMIIPAQQSASKCGPGLAGRP